MTVESDLENGLMTRVTEFANFFVRSDIWNDAGYWYNNERLDGAFVYAPQSPYPVAFPDVPFPHPDRPTEDQVRHLHVMHFRNTNGPDLWGTTKRLRGILQVSVVDPQQEGTQIGIEIGSAIATYFQKNTRWNYGSTMIKIVNTPTLLTPIVQGHKTEYPVSIPYRVTQREA